MPGTTVEDFLVMLHKSDGRRTLWNGAQCVSFQLEMTASTLESGAPELCFAVCCWRQVVVTPLSGLITVFYLTEHSTEVLRRPIKRVETFYFIIIFF